MKMKKISVLIPCYNEEQSLPLLYPELVKLMDSQPAYEWELMFVNDGSRDGTLRELKRLRQLDQRVNYVDLSRNFGKENAMLAGFDYVTGDCMVIIDADLQHPPTLIPEMIKWWEQGYDDVYAKRKTRGKESWLRKHLSLQFYKILQSSSRFDVLQNVGDFRLLDRSCINALKSLRESERYTKGMYSWIGFKNLDHRRIRRFAVRLPVHDLCADQGGHLGRPGAGLSHSGDSHPVPGRHPVDFAGYHRRVHRSHLQRDQEPSRLHRARVQ